MKNQVSKTPSSNSRNYGIDLLRLFSMYLIVIRHFSSSFSTSSGMLQGFTGFMCKDVWVSFSLCAVNCYAMITGYVYTSARYRYRNLALLWLRVVFYTIPFSVIFYLLRLPSPLPIRTVIAGFFPVLSHTYWYVSSYVILFLFIPVLNLGISQLNQKQLKSIILGLLLIFSVLEPLYAWLLDIGNGFDSLWLIVMYLIGTYVRKYEPFAQWRSQKAFSVYAVFCIASLALELMLRYAEAALKNSNTFITVILQMYQKMIVSNVSLFVVGAALFLLVAFRNLHSLPPALCKAISLTAPLSFGVYIIHTYPQVANILRSFARKLPYCGFFQPFAVLAGCFVIFAACIFTDWIREQLFQKLHVRQRLTALENRYLNIW